VSESLPPPAPSPQPPKGPGETTQPGIASTEYVKAKLLAVEQHLAQVADHAAREAAREEHNGTPVISRALTPWFLAGFTLCGSVTTVAMSFEGAIPRPVLVAAAVGSMFFGAMLGIGPGLRRP
jgi:hypothetical protein